jgi:uncharacterized protein
MSRFPLRTLRLRSGEEHQDEVAVELQPFVIGGERYLPVPASPQARLTVTRATSGDVFRLQFAMRLHGPCMRCLADAVVDIAIDATEYHASDLAAGDELRSEYVVEDQLDLSSWARDAIASALPEQILCRPDCAGLCPVCGKDLNVEPHEHAEQAGDPRWAALEELRDRLS